MKIFDYKQLLFILLSTLFLLNNLFAQTNEDCLMCHDDKTLTAVQNGKTVSMYVNQKLLLNSVHKNLTCISCHKDAKVIDFPHSEKLSKVDCGSCHAGYSEQLKNDIHKRILKKTCENKPTCKTCHNTHYIKNPSKIKNKSKEFCGKCHKENVLSAAYHTNTQVNESCKKCHKEKNYTVNLRKSVHNKLTCANCHGFIANNIELHQKGNVKNKTADCFVCHPKITAEHKESIHGVALEEGIDDAAKCWSCHGSHLIYKVTSDSSTANPRNLVKTCGKCHDDVNFTRKHLFALKNPGKMYSISVHGKLLASGSTKAPSCINCHGVHNIKNRIQANSTISATQIPITCSKCHKKIAEQYMQSIHWIAVKKGVRKAPTCNDCHSEHDIKAVNIINDRAAVKKIQDNTCLVCHNNMLSAKKYGLTGINVSSYRDSYHGLASSFGNLRAAMCVDCHGVHKILPAYSEESSINKKNLTNTCKKCHPEATKVFSQSYTHVSEETHSAKFIENIVKTIYLWLIFIVIGGMILHNVIIFIHDLKEKHKHEKLQIRIPRFTLNELIQHTFLLTSFIVLSLSGFLLKYSDSWFADILQNIGFDENIRRIVHRVAAIVMIALSLYHIVYLIATKRGRSLLNGLLPRFNDLKAAGQNVMYYLRLRKKHPDFENFNYIEKAEYWALIWGTIVMVITGFVLWFPTIVGNWAPVWFIKVSEIIHFYEAVLATLAIIIWHWFFVMFRPKEYPLNFTVIDGQMTLEHYKDEHYLRFKKVIVEWLKIKNGSKEKRKMSYFTKFFITALEKKGINVEDFFMSEIEKDENLQKYISDNNIETE
ncbi:MAG: DUF4405 domain-containing protein [Chlorobi bacterium]|nr:DUF4405 domain-containing protein [Chlorobiota bacterium]